ncbi:MAG: hypothetical protein LAT75_08530 [Candidatus Cyclonatronum sp.]|uniref:hypothetical protein n=1 Tax=Cyclonatronum sp. TaxID=3024185 RepID=UPI0025B99678|nr:hypothetical protein [Cyclonatronum sp.]MCH8486898.1 hypothetical protein [Cyclonatronum sp.]
MDDFYIPGAASRAGRLINRPCHHILVERSGGGVEGSGDQGAVAGAAGFFGYAAKT